MLNNYPHSLLGEKLCSLPVVDTHEHFHLFSDDQGYDLISFLYCNSYTNTLEMYLDPELVATINDISRTINDRYKAFCKAYENIRYTRAGRNVREIVQFWGVDDVSLDNMILLQEAYAKRSQIVKMPEQICAYIVNSAGHPLYGYVKGLKKYVGGGMSCPEKVYVNPLITGLHCISSWNEIMDISTVAEIEIGSVDELIIAVQNIMESCVRMGAVGFKDVYTYMRAYEIGRPNRFAAERDFVNIRTGALATGALSDYMFYQVYDIAQQLAKPMGVHTGFIITTCQPASYLKMLHPIITCFPNLAFDLYHFNYPLLEPYIQTMKSFSNVYANGAWVTGMMTEYSKQFLKEALHSISPERILVYGGDCHCAGEMTQITLKNALQVVDEVLSESIYKSYLSISEAEEVAKIWLSKSTKNLYHI